MATWDDMDNFTMDELELFTVDELERLTLPQIRKVVDTVWPIVRALGPEEREHLKSGLLDGTIPPNVVLYQVNEPSAPGVEALFASNRIWDKLKPQSRAETIAYVGIIASLLQLGVSLMPDDNPPDVNVVIQILPEQLRPETPPATPPLPDERDI